MHILTPAEALRQLRDEDMATTNKYTLRLLASLKSEAEKVVATEGTPLDQLINVAVVVKNERLKA